MNDEKIVEDRPFKNEEMKEGEKTDIQSDKEDVSAKTVKEENNQKEYSIINFITKDSEILIAVVTAMVTIISFIIKMISAIITQNKLVYWGIDPSLVNDKNSYVIYIIFAILFSFFYGICFIWNIYFFDSNKGRIKHLKECRKEKSIIVEKVFKNTYLKEAIWGKTEKREIEEIYQKYNLMKEEYRDTRIKYHRVLFLDFLITYIILCIAIFSVLVYPPVSLPRGYETGLFLALAFVFSFIVVSTCRIMAGISIKKAMKETGNDEGLDCSDKERKFSKENENTVQYFEHLISKIKVKELKDYFYDSAIVTCFFTFVVVLIVFIFVFPHVLPCFLECNHEFKVIQLDETQYISVYSDSDIMILEEAEINEKDVTVFTNKQHIIQTADGLFEIVKFDKVDRKEKHQ